MDLAQRIKQLASKRGITIAELERKAGISNGQISKWNVRSPKTKNLEKVAKYLNVSLDYLTGNSDSKNTADLAAKDTVFTFEGREIPPEDLEYMKRLLRGGKQ